MSVLFSPIRDLLSPSNNSLVCFVIQVIFYCTLSFLLIQKKGYKKLIILAEFSAFIYPLKDNYWHERSPSGGRCSGG